MDRLERARRPVRNEIRKSIKELEDFLKADPIPHFEVQAGLHVLSASFEALEEINTKIFDTLIDEDATTEEELDQELEAVRKFKIDYMIIKAKAEKVIQDNTEDDSISQVSFRTGVNQRRKIKLPKVELRKFGGDLKQWLGWWSQFQKIHLDTELDEVDKFYYLLQYMEPESEAQKMTESYPQTAGNYQKAIKSLEERYGNRDLLLQVYLRELLSLVISNATNKDKVPLAQLQVQLQSHLRSLSELKLDEADPATWLYPLVESCLTESLLRAWQRSELAKTDGKRLNPPKTRLDLLMDFIQTEVRSDQQISLAQSGFSTNEDSSRKKNKKPRSGPTIEEEVSTAAGLLSTTRITERISCVFCDRSHQSDHCISAQSKSLEGKKELVESKGVCYICLSGRHTAKKCKAFVKCIICGSRHYPIMCPMMDGDKSNHSKPETTTEDPSGSANEQTSKTFQAGANLQCGPEILIPTLIVNIRRDNGKWASARVGGDTGSHRSWIKTSIIHKMRCKHSGEEWIRSVLFDGSLTKPKLHGKYIVNLKNTGSNAITSLELLKRDHFGGKIAKIPKGPWIDELARNKVQLSDVGDEETDLDIIIGSDYWSALQTGKIIKLKCGLVAQETILGWTLSGRIQQTLANSYINLLCSTAQKDIAQLWELESLGIRDPIETKSANEEEREAIKLFKSTVTRDSDGRYIVALPWRLDSSKLPSNSKIAEKRLQSATKRLSSQQKFGAYEQVFQAWEQEHFISTILNDDGTGHYLPHRPVFKESVTTPVRPVYDASCKVGQYPSLNQCLYTGPNLIELIPSVLLRFRENPIGVISDIRKAFQMIKVREEDRKYQKFLWWEDATCQKLKIYEHNRVVFGVTCSPFLLGAVINYHITNSEDDPIFKDKLWHSFYVDNSATSVSSRNEYYTFRESAENTMKKAGMDLRQWASTIQPNEKILNEVEEVVVPLLGMEWNRKDDTLSCTFEDFTFPEVITKRTILSFTAQIFDPVGILAPSTLIPKLLIQELWATKRGWDEPVSEEISNEFSKWMEESPRLKQVKIPRHFQLHSASSREVHVYSDASQAAYAAAVFIRSESDGEVKVQLLMAKSRLAPMDKGTIPRLELMGCLLGVRLAESVRAALLLEGVPIFYWTDSSTAYTWITRDSSWAPFVRNRVVEIRQCTKAEQWLHVSGKHNPADLPSRGCTPRQLLVSEWWNGPSWLKLDKNKWPRSPVLINEEEVMQELSKTQVMTSLVGNNSSPRFSSYQKNVAVYAWILRFINLKCRRVPIPSSNLTLSELRMAEKILLREVQSEAFPLRGKELGGIIIFTDESGLLRLKTKLVNREDQEYFKFPILLPKSHPLVDQLILDIHHFHGHGGVNFLCSKLREKYWVVQSKRVVRRVLKTCVQCQRHSVKRLEVEPAALPKKRVTGSRPFETTGVDLAGPLKLKDGSSAWIVLYTCAMYRCVHLDLVTSLSTEVFLRSMERFINIYGRPNTVYSDNGTNFVGAANLFKHVNWTELEKESNVKKIQWVFNPPTAAWWGGFWERLVKSTKDLLKRMLGRARLSYDELLTCVSGVASTMNDRPLTLLGGDTDDLVPLTPAMFLRGGGAHFPDVAEIDSLKRSYRKMKTLQQELQARFRKEYLANLVMKTDQNERRCIALGDVVLIGADNRKRFEWPLGVIVKLFPGKDGHTRVVRVKTSHGMFLRPLQRVYPLEISSSSDQILEENVQTPLPEVSSNADGNDQPDKVKVVTRRGRQVKQPIRYGQWFHLVKT